MKYNVQDNHFFAQYIPMISASFWKKMPADLQKMVTATWAEMVVGFRDEMAKSQAHAVDVIKEKGIAVVQLSKADIDAARKRLMATQDEVAKELGLEAALVARASAALGIDGKA